MKNLIVTILLIYVLAPIQAQSKKNVSSILLTYERLATQYLKEKAEKEYPKPTIEQKNVIVVNQMTAKVTIESINKEVEAKFKKENSGIENTDAIVNFVEYQYKIHVSGLSDDFYKKASAELNKI